MCSSQACLVQNTIDSVAEKQSPLRLEHNIQEIFTVIYNRSNRKQHTTLSVPGIQGQNTAIKIKSILSFILCFSKESNKKYQCYIVMFPIAKYLQFAMDTNATARNLVDAILTLELLVRAIILNNPNPEVECLTVQSVHDDHPPIRSLRMNCLQSQHL